MSANPYPIYIISLKRNPERRLYVQRQLDALHLDYQFVDAIDKHDLESSECQAEICELLGADKNNIKKKYRGMCNSKELATTLSHIKAYKLMAEHNESAACILEDDAQISPDFPAILRVAKKKSWDILMLSSQSVVIRAIISRNINLRKSIIESPQTNCSLFPKLRKTRRGKELLPPTPTSSSELDWALIPKSQWQQLMFLSSGSANKPKNTNKSREFRNNITEPHWSLGSVPIPDCPMPSGLLTSYIACKIGALPLRVSQKNLYGGYDIAIPAERPTSGMAYLLTAEMTKKVIESFTKKERVVIDIIPWHLYQKYGIKLRILTPPCVTASLIYLLYSNPKYRQLKDQLNTN